jgi:hypothetical protein
MTTIIYANKEAEYHSIQLGNYPTFNFFQKCERYGLKVFCILEGSIMKEKCVDFEDHQNHIQPLLQKLAPNLNLNA